MILSYLTWVKVGNSRDSNIRPQIMILSNISTLMTLVHIIKEGGFTYNIWYDMMEREQISIAKEHTHSHKICTNYVKKYIPLPEAPTHTVNVMFAIYYSL